MDRRSRGLLAAVLAVWGLLMFACRGELGEMWREFRDSGALGELLLTLELGPRMASDADVPPEDGETLPAAPAETGEIPEVLPADPAGTEIRNFTSRDVDLSELQAETLTQRLPRSGPQVLIIHTHSTEAYTPVPGEEYEPSDPWRTTDPARSVIRVGDVLAAALEAQGLSVVHDRGVYDYPSYNGAYDRSQAAIEAWLSLFPEIAVVLDVHRDAVGADKLYKTLVRDIPESAAQVMLVVGTGENGLPHPRWRENLKLALALQTAAEDGCPTLTRPVRLGRERYNQHLTAGSLILEVGTNGNTLSEAERGAELFAAAAGPVLLSLVEADKE